MSETQAPTTRQGSKQGFDAFFFNPEYLEGLAKEHQDAWQTADPFPHLYIDDFVPEWVVNQLLEEFPGRDRSIDLYEEPNESRKGKAASTDISQLGPFTRHMINEFNSSQFLRFLEGVTGVEHLIADPHLMGGGVHETKRGGFLKIHADFNWEPKLRLDRRLNAILYLNHDWDDAFGGHLELWSKDMSRCVKKVAPKAGRMVLFYVADDSNHGHPDPMTCPEDRTRKSMAFFYYTNGRPKAERSLPHTTNYKRRPGEQFQRRTALGSRRILQKFIPPIVNDLLAYKRSRDRESE